MIGLPSWSTRYTSCSGRPWASNGKMLLISTPFCRSPGTKNFPWATAGVGVTVTEVPAARPPRKISANTARPVLASSRSHRADHRAGGDEQAEERAAEQRRHREARAALRRQHRAEELHRQVAAQHPPRRLELRQEVRSWKAARTAPA